MSRGMGTNSIDGGGSGKVSGGNSTAGAFGVVGISGGVGWLGTCRSGQRMEKPVQERAGAMSFKTQTSSEQSSGLTIRVSHCERCLWSMLIKSFISLHVEIERRCFWLRQGRGEIYVIDSATQRELLALT